MTDYKFSIKQIQKMKHCIGFNDSKVSGTKNRKMEAYRNRYASCKTDDELEDLVQQGLMRVYEESEGEKIKYQSVYYVTEKGFKFLSELTGITISEMR